MEDQEPEPFIQIEIRGFSDLYKNLTDTDPEVVYKANLNIRQFMKFYT
jgi:hypothetical protein